MIGEHQHGHGGTGSRDCFAYHARSREWKRREAILHFQPGSTERGGGRWYPTLVTLADGQAIAVGGHPRAGDDEHADNYPTPETRRHSNNIPERYTPAVNAWKLMSGSQTAPDGPAQFLDEYDRLHVTPTGHVFFSTIAKSKGDTRLFDPYTGNFAADGYGNHLDARYDDANCSSRTTSVILPILHGIRTSSGSSCAEPSRPSGSISRPLPLRGNRRASGNGATRRRRCASTCSVSCSRPGRSSSPAACTTASRAAA